ncbi:SRSO17 transposase [Methylobacterium sp. OAE515]
MSSASLESTLELWSMTLRQAKQRIRPLFAAPSVAASANAFLDGLLGGERRKTGWMRAEAAGDPGPWRQQAILGRTHWDAEALRDVVRDEVVETLASPDAVLVVDETGFLKQGKASCGVGRQYTGSAGKITNCQIGVFAAYVSAQGHAFIDRRLYLPKAWTGDPARRQAAHVPEAITFATKPQLALAMIERAIQAEVPFAWVAADSIYGVGEIEMALRRAYKGYVLGVTGQHRFWSWDANLDVAGTAADIAKSIPDQNWLRLSAGAGSKGARLFDWAYLPLATLRADALDAALDQSLWTRGLLVRRSLSDGALAYFTTGCPAGTLVEKLAMVEGRRSRDRGRVRDRQDGTRIGPQREPLVARLAPACQLGDAGLRDAGAGAPAGQRAAPKTTLIAKLAGAVVHSGDPTGGDAAGAAPH